MAKNPSTGTAQQRLFLVLKAVLHAVVVISEVLHLSTKSRCSRCCRHISSLESDKHVTAGKTLKRLTKLMDRLHSIELGYDEGMESKTIMVPANGMVYKLREELKNDGALLFGPIFLAYLDIGGEYFCSLHPLFTFMCALYFCLVLAVMP